MEVFDPVNEAVQPGSVPEAPRVPKMPAPLVPLTPKFRDGEHDLYLKRIVAALNDRSRTAPRNIALTGSYGSGKSSVLEGLLRKRRYRPIRISLSTINPTRAGEDKADEALAISNVIQKEIVKQILYRERVGKMSGSRFRRVDKFHWFGPIWLALGTSLFVAVVGYLNGWTKRLEDLATFYQAEPWVVALVAIVVLTVGLVGLQRIFHGRLKIKGLSAGPAQIELKEDESAFDRYLDEIVYFFAVSGCTAAIFEDLDRFHRIEIYEELRSLNVLLNNSGQLRRPVRFIYAMRDSLFEEFGGESAPGMVGQAQPRANVDATTLRLLVAKAADRAKFFDLVLPMVPFATLRTAIDLWREELPESTRVSLKAIQVAATHIQDMRLIRNVRNEFHVFSEELTRNGLGGIESDSVFGLMLYKNVYLDDFEAIRIGASLLDAVETIRQDTVTKVLLEWDESNRLTKDPETQNRRREDRARRSGEKLLDAMTRSFKIASRPLPTLSFKVGTRSFDTDEILEAEFWEELEGAGWQMDITQGVPAARSATVTVQDVESWIGFDPETIDWSETIVDDSGVDDSPKDRERLARAEIHELLGGDLLTETQRAALEASVRESIKSGLAWDLISGGFIDQNFSLYVSRFYGRVITANAMNFILHVVQKGRYAPFAQVTGSIDVDAVVNVVGSDFLATQSALNIGLFEALADDPRLDAALQFIPGADQAFNFLDTYLSSGARCASVIERLSATWPTMFTYLLRDETPKIEIVELMNAALRGLSSEVSYERAAGLAEFVNAHADDLGVLKESGQASDPAALASFLGRENVQLDSIDGLPEPLRGAVFAVGSFKVNARNLEAGFGPSTSWALDSVAPEKPGTLDRLVRNLDEYLSVLPRSTPPLSQQTNLPTYVSRIQTLAGTDGLTRVLRRTPRGLTAQDLTKYPQKAWETLALERRILPKPANLLAYARAFGIDPPMTKLIGDTAAPMNSSLSDAENRELALFIVHAAGIAKTKRAKWVKALKLSTPLEMSELADAEGEIVPYLVALGTVEDTEDTFIALRDRPWVARELLIRKSTAFLTYLPALPLLDSEILALFDGSPVSGPVKLAIIESSAAIPAKLSERTATAVGKFFLTYSGSLKWTVMDMLISGRCSPEVLVQILVRYQYKMPRLTDNLALMPSPWRDLSGRAARKPLVPDNPTTLKLLTTLKDSGVVSSWDGSKNGQLRVQVRKTT